MPKPATALPALAPLAVCAALVAGCSDSAEDELAPSACLAGDRAYLWALEAAPGEVLLGGETPISDCLTPGQEGGQLAAIGKEMVEAATELNVEAQRDPEGRQALRLGYLIGAVERGAEGIHADLVRRLGSAARFSPDGRVPPGFERGYERGYEAGLASG